MDKTSQILVLVEGAKTDLRLMKHLLHIYGIDSKHDVVSYDTNIYVLYNQMFGEGDPDSIDLLQLLKEKEMDSEKKKIFDVHYSDIILIFDFDPHDPLFASGKILEMMQYFNESSDTGKLYINYPMVESFYHMKSIPDEEYVDCVASLDELVKGTYKQRVNKENRNRNYLKFAVNREECNIVIRQNIEKAWHLTKTDKVESFILPDLMEVLKKQLQKIEQEKVVSVLCTCAFYIVEYNPKFIQY